MPRTLQQLNATEKRDLIRTVRGELPGAPNPSTAALARRFGILESSVEAVRTAATTPAPAPKAAGPTRTLAEAARERLILESADTLLEHANKAEERGLHNASLQELAAVAAMAVPR